MKRLGFIGLALGFAIVTDVYAQSLQVQFRQYSLNLSGFDEHMIDEYEYTITSERRDFGEGDYAYLNIYDETRYRPNILYMPQRSNSTFNLIFTSPRWGFELQSFKYGAFVSKKDTIETPRVKHNNDGTTTVSIFGIRQWGRDIRPEDNEADSSGLSPVFWYAANKFNLMTTRTLIFFRVNASFEVAIGREQVWLNNYQNLGQRHTIYVDNYYGYDLNGKTLYSQYASTDYVLRGPSIGLRAQNKYFDVSIVQSLFSSKNIKGKGIWEKKVDGVWTERGTQNVYMTFDYGTANPYSGKKTSTNISHTELSMRFSHFPFNIKNVSIGYEIGLIASYFNQIVIAPEWRFKDGWRTQTRDLLFYGLFLGVTTKV